MSKVKKVLIALVILVLIFPIGAGAETSVSGGLCVGGSSFSFCLGGNNNGNGFGGGLSSLSGMGLPEGSIYGIIENIVFWLLGLFAFFGIIGFTISGIMYLISAGDDEMITKAKKYMMYSIMGVIVGLMGYVIIQAVYWMLGGNNAAF